MILKTDFTGKETGITFEISFESSYGMVKELNLIPNGSEIAVTEENKKHFVNKYLDWLLIDSIKQQFDPFCKGFYNVLQGEILKLFTAKNLFLAICGSNKLDFKELRRTTKYQDYTEHSESVKHFWKVILEDFDQEM